MKTLRSSFYIIFLSALFVACKKDAPEPKGLLKNDVPEFFNETESEFYGKTPPAFTVFGKPSHNLIRPQDLDFNTVRPDELWVLNLGSENTGGSTVMYTNPGTDNQKTDFRIDGNAWHFMALPSALSFSNNGNWATSANILDANRNNGTFTGPSLWSSNLSVYAKPSGGNGSHLDMLHASPYGMGIESEKDNIFWLFDGYNGHIVRFDFVQDHGPGNDNHDDGIVRRYTELSVKRDAEVPSHLVLDAEKKWLYIVDGGNKRVLRANIKTGSKFQELSLINEQLAEHSEYRGIEWEIVVPANTSLKRPCGIDLKDNRLFVSDFETGQVVCYDINTNQEVARVDSGDAGIMGIKIGPNGRIYYVNSKTNEVGRIDPR